MNIKGFFTIVLVTFVSVVNGEAAVQEVEAVQRDLQAVVNFGTNLANAINMKRSERGVNKAICLNAKLMAAAQIQATDMATNNFVATTGSDGSTPTVRYTRQGFTATTSTELVAAGYSSASAVLAAWIQTGALPRLLGNYKYMGIGYKYDSTKAYRHFWVLDLANANGYPYGEVCGYPYGYH
ncbi:hypothetical protein PHMEG_00011713 [Phytophthora megakarya]|uniref:SCP domain-containing protein n=1 Tax=Phytophthora megakarya TaxID=4795 RepID=A0A225WBJ3_9STRA|nr:hypothetical protein PHMEG_00011713 [Phytophthora megakarya]